MQETNTKSFKSTSLVLKNRMSWGKAVLAVFFVMVAVFSAAIFSFAQVANVPRWHPHDFVFTSSGMHENPFTVEFTADVEGPAGKTLTTLGFYDGNNTWKVRISPDTEGRWTIRTRSNDEQLSGKSIDFLCVPNNNPSNHGGLRIDFRHPYHFVFDDGTRYFMMAYECDWLWALDLTNETLPTLNPFLDKLAVFGFNNIVLNTYAHDSKWTEGKTEVDDYGPPPVYAWEGSNEKPIHGRLNLKFWKHYDQVIEAMMKRGIVAHIMIKVYNKMVNWPKQGSYEDELFFRWVIARYAAFPNVIWDFSKETQYEKDINHKTGRIQFIRQNDPYKRLITVHDDEATYEKGIYNELLDFRSDQQHSDWHQAILHQREQKIWPVLNIELGYEHGPKGLYDKTFSKGTFYPEEICRRAWEVFMAGGYATYYYTYTAWDVIRTKDTPPGLAYFRQFKDFIEKTGYWLMRPDDALVSDGYCLANPGKEYIVFHNDTKPFTIFIKGASEPLRGEWFHPYTGEKIDAGELSEGKVELSPPSKWENTQVVFHAGAPPKQ